MNPGPGKYDPKVILTKEQAPIVSISLTERNGLNSNYDMPAPGQYDPKDQRYTNINFKFSDGEKPDAVSRDARSYPGPG